jgi:hypothetical protein
MIKGPGLKNNDKFKGNISREEVEGPGVYKYT